MGDHKRAQVGLIYIRERLKLLPARGSQTPDDETYRGPSVRNRAQTQEI